MNLLSKLFNKKQPSKTTDANLFSNSNQSPLLNNNNNSGFLPSNKSNQDIIIESTSYTPSDIRGILSTPSIYNKYQLYSSMEIFWPRLLRSMDYLKCSVASNKITLKPIEDNNNDALLKHNLIQLSIDNMVGNLQSNTTGWKDLIKNIISSYGYGITLQKYTYKEVDGYIIPEGTTILSGILYEYDQVNNNLFLQAGKLPIDSNKYLTALYRNRSTPNLTTLGVYQSLALLFSFQSLASKYLLQLSERFGMPLVHGKYPKDGTTQQFVTQFNSYLANLGSSGYLTTPEYCTVEFIQSAINASNNPQQALLDYCDRQCDLVMLGGNLTSEVDQGSLASSKVHERKENNIIYNLTQYVIDTLNNQYIPTILSINDLSLDNKPEFHLESEKDLDILTKKLDIVSKIKSLGYTVNNESLIKEIAQYGITVDNIQPVNNITLSDIANLQPNQQDNNVVNKEDDSLKPSDNKQ